jgi:dihydroorotate dehydrogenase (NAD+) catalytic subunit
VSAYGPVDLGGLKMKNPFTTASGTFGSGREFAALWAVHGIPLSVLGAVTTKGVSLEPWAGNAGVRVAETASGLLNSIGLQNPGVEAFCAGDLAWLAAQDVPVIVNVSGHTEAEYAAVVARLEHEPVAAYELNISCPNVDAGGMSFGTDPLAAARVTAACRAATRRPLIVKLTPNVTDITVIAKAVADAGADALSLINTVAGTALDVTAGASVFARGVAGLSGPAIKPIALYAVARVHQAVDLPLIGMGGIATAADVAEFQLAGATAVAGGTANDTDPMTKPRQIGELSP